MQQVTAQELAGWKSAGRKFVLVDVREEWEHAAFNIGGLLLPMSEFASRAGEVPMGEDVVLYCEKGIRSVIAIQRLEALGYPRLFNLSGGMKAWRSLSPARSEGAGEVE